MRRSHLLLIGFAACAVAGYWIATAQAPPVEEPEPFGPVPAAQIRLWPPRAQDMVNVYRESTAVEETLFTVPDDRWLVVVVFRASWTQVPTNIRLIERTDGADAVRWNAYRIGSYEPALPVGLVFAPGSEVVVQITTIFSGTMFYGIAGYLTDQ